MYTIVEMQTNAGVTAVLTQTAADRNQAESIYHQILASAAISSVEIHAASLLSEYGFLLLREAYEHKKEAEE